VLLDNPNSTRFASHLKTDMIPVFMAALHLSKDDARAGYILEFYVTAIISTVSHWIHSKRDISVEELGALIRDVLQAGVLAHLAKYTVAP
jgi:hypothetical protein